MAEIVAPETRQRPGWPLSANGNPQRLLLCAVSFDVGLGRFSSMMGSLGMVPVSYVSVMCSFLMIACSVVPGGFLVVTGRVLMMLGGLGMVVRSFLGRR